MTNEKSPLDELRRPVDDFWQKVTPGYALADEEIAALVIAERKRRVEWQTKSTKKKVKREEKQNDENVD